MNTEAQQEVQTPEEVEAAFFEGVAPITEDTMELVLRIRELNKLMAPLKAEAKAAQELIIEEMRERHVNKFTQEGVVQVENIITNKTKTDLPGIIRAHPDVIGIYVTKEKGTRFDVKK